MKDRGGMNLSFEVGVRRIGAEDWREWRALRLQALAEAPYAFGSTLEEWQGAGDREQRWRYRLATVPFNIIAGLGGAGAGMASGTDRDVDGTVELISMWVAPFARSRGVGDALVAAVVGWAQEQGASRVVLAVVEGNDRAMALYRRHGFCDAGAIASVDSGGVPERRMVHSFEDQGTPVRGSCCRG